MNWLSNLLSRRIGRIGPINPLANASRSDPEQTPQRALGSAAGPPLSAERVKQFYAGRYNPIRGLTPELLSQYLDSYRSGFLKQAVLIWDLLEERDDMLINVVNKSKKAVSRNGYEIVTLEGAPAPEADRHRDALQNFWANISVTSAIDQDLTGEISLLLRQMMDAKAKGYAAHHIAWDPQPGKLTATFSFVPLYFFERTIGKLRFLPSDYEIYGTELDPRAWLITVGPALMAACSVAWMYKNLCLKDWLIYSERHGMPGIHGKTSAAKNSTEWEDMVTAVQNFAADWALVTNSDAAIEKIDLATQGQLPYPPLVERMDRAIAAIWRGADLSTLSAASGQGQGASLQSDESDILEMDDAAWLSETLSRHIERRVIAWHFGDGAEPLAYIRIKTTARKNTDQDLKVDQALHAMGAPVPIAALLERYERPAPAAGEPLLPPPVASVPPVLPNIAPALEGDSRSAILAATLRKTLGAQAALLEPWLAELAALDHPSDQSDQSDLSDSAFLARLEALIAQLPELLTPDAIAALAQPLEAALAQAMLTTLETAPQK